MGHRRPGSGQREPAGGQLRVPGRARRGEPPA